VSLSEEHEFAKLKVTELPHRAVDMDLEWVGLPIADGSLYLVVGATHSASPCSEYEPQRCKSRRASESRRLRVKT